MHIYNLPAFFWTNNTGLPYVNTLGLFQPFASISYT